MLPDVSRHVSFPPQGVCHSDALRRRAAGGSEESFRVQKRSVARSAPAAVAAAEDVSEASSLSCKLLNAIAKVASIFSLDRVPSADREVEGYYANSH